MNEQTLADKWEDIRLGQSHPVTPEQTAVAFDHWSADDIREYLDDEDDVELAMQFFDRVGFRFSWYERPPDAPASLWNKTGLMWSMSFADGSRAAERGLSDRQLLEDWLDRIKAHVYDMVVAARGLPIPTGHSHARVWLPVPGGYMLPDEAIA